MSKETKEKKEFNRDLNILIGLLVALAVAVWASALFSLPRILK